MPARLPPDPAAPPPAGSMRWYAWLFAPPATRDALAALFALEAELRSVPDSRVDHGVAHLKLRWWREELLRLEQREPRHPLTQAALRAAPWAEPALRSLRDLLSSIELDLACATYATEAELDRYLALTAGLQRAMALAAHREPASERLEQFASAAGQAVRGIEIIRDLHRDARDGRIYLPRVWLAAEGVEPAELRTAPAGDGVRRCLERLAAGSRDLWRDARQALDDIDCAGLRGQRVLGELHITLLDRLEHWRFDVSRGGAEPGPAQRLWTAWRAARQH